MVSQDTASDPNSSILHHFLISSSDPTNTEAHLQTQNLNPYGIFPTIHSLGERISRSVNLLQADESEMGHYNSYFMNLFRSSNDTNALSLSLNSQGLVPGLCFMGGESSFVGTNPSYSRYLRPVQLLLQEATNVGGNALEVSDLRRLFLSGSKGATSSELKSQLLNLSCKHEFQIKISELIALLEQLENKYEEYCNRTEETASSFEVIAGEGSAKAYTSLALEAMCRHFCSLRNAILAQLKVEVKKLSSELPHIRAGLISKLSLFDRETRQNRMMSLQQLGWMQQCQRQVWRPIRGLPEHSVAILRAWLFEHFLNPYPNESEKLMLASQTGLTKNQVSNWFINARVRFWKPMIEEMYADEFGESSSPGDSDPFFSSSCGSSREAHHDPFDPPVDQ